MQIINSIEENTVHKYSIEETWQSSTCQFIHGVTKSYYGYEDVITPILSCVYQIKQGVRLLLLNSKTRASKLSENMELNALFNNFLALPSSRNLSSYKSILDSLPDKIKILVLHAVLNYQMIARFKENSPNVLKEFDDVFLEYVYIWQRASAEREKQKWKIQAFINLKIKNLMKQL